MLKISFYNTGFHSVDHGNSPIYFISERLLPFLHTCSSTTSCNSKPQFSLNLMCDGSSTITYSISSANKSRLNSVRNSGLLSMLPMISLICSILLSSSAHTRRSFSTLRSLSSLVIALVLYIKCQDQQAPVVSTWLIVDSDIINQIFFC